MVEMRVRLGGEGCQVFRTRWGTQALGLQDLGGDMDSGHQESRQSLAGHTGTLSSSWGSPSRERGPDVRLCQRILRDLILVGLSGENESVREPGIWAGGSSGPCQPPVLSAASSAGTCCHLGALELCLLVLAYSPRAFCLELPRNVPTMRLISSLGAGTSYPSDSPMEGKGPGVLVVVIQSYHCAETHKALQNIWSPLQKAHCRLGPWRPTG